MLAGTGVATTCDPGSSQNLAKSIIGGVNDACTLTNSITTAPTFSATKPFHLTTHLACPTAPAAFPDHDIHGDPRVAPIPLGNIVRFERDRVHPESLPLETADVLKKIIEGGTSEVVDRALSDLLGL